MVGARPDYSSHAPLPLPAPLRGAGVGGRAGAHLGPSSQGSLARSGTRAQTGGKGEETRPGPVPAGLAPLSLSLYGRAPTASRTGPGAPAEGARAAPREGGREGGGGKMRAQSPVRGGGTVERPPSCLPLLTCVLGGVRTTPPPAAEEGGGPPLGRRLRGL